jgi:hypothetical protein
MGIGVTQGLERGPGTDRSAAGSALLCERIGEVLLVHADGPVDRATRLFARQLAEEVGRTVVVADVDPDCRPDTWESVAEELSAVPGTLRLVPSRRTRMSTAAIGLWLAERLDREVIAHEGKASTVADGALFVPPSAGRGWLRFLPGRDEAAPFSRRYPTPAWEGQAFAEPRVLAEDLVAEPLPAGVWIHAAEESARSRVYRKWLFTGLAGALDQPRAVIGHPGSAPVPVGRIAAFWHRLPAEVRPAVRFDRFGPVETLSGGASAGAFGQSLADLLGSPVTVGLGVRVTVAPTDLRTLLPEGAMNWTPFATDVAYVPRRTTGGVAAGPHVVMHRPPVPGLVETGSGIYEYDSDAVLEVTQSGLWVRPVEPPAGTAEVRSLPPDLSGAKLFFESGMRDVAVDVKLRMDPDLRTAFRILPADSLTAPEQAATQTAAATTGGTGVDRMSMPVPAPPPSAPAWSSAPVPPPPPVVARPRVQLESELQVERDLRTPSVLPPVPEPESAVAWIDVVAAKPSPVSRVRKDPDVRVQPVPKPEASAVPPPRGIQQERTWLRRTLSQQYDATVNYVSRVVSEVPGLRGNAAITSAELLSDLVAVRLYLTGDTRGLDDAVRAGEIGAHVPLARCVATGLRHLPSYRGAARLRTDLTAAQTQWYRDRSVVTEWAFSPALTTGHPLLRGDVDFLIWSVTARRTALLDPTVDGQAVFLPGTSFKVLRIDAAGARTKILLREIGSSEVGPDGRLLADPGPMDEPALHGLERADELWRADESETEPPAALADRFSAPPGLFGVRTGGSRRTTWTTRGDGDE